MGHRLFYCPCWWYHEHDEIAFLKPLIFTFNFVPSNDFVSHSSFGGPLSLCKRHRKISLSDSNRSLFFLFVYFFYSPRLDSYAITILTADNVRASLFASITKTKQCSFDWHAWQNKRVFLYCRCLLQAKCVLSYTIKRCRFENHFWIDCLVFRRTRWYVSVRGSRGVPFLHHQILLLNWALNESVFILPFTLVPFDCDWIIIADVE